MKSCPTCNRTFDDTLTFCLIDGSVLSPPFDPNSPRDQQIVEDAPPATIRYEEPQRTRATLRASDVSPTVAADTVPGTESAGAKESDPSLTVQSRSAPEPMKTIGAPPPEFVFDKNALGSRASAAKVQDGGSNKSRAVIVAGGIIVVAIVVVGGFLRLQQKKAGSGPQTASKKTAPKATPTGALFSETVNGVEIQMVAIPGGTFTMGSPTSEAGRDPDEGPQAEVNVESFYMSKFEVTQAEYRAVTGSNPSSFKGDNLPVDSVAWSDAVEFCRKISQVTGRSYRLPTEAEWEYAARAKTNGAFAGDINALAWYDANSGHQTHPVGQKQPNAFGLYDMNGNVWEWCQSKYKPYPYNASDGRESLQENDVRVLRGGSWESAARGCRSAYRRRVTPDPRATGFRVILTP